MEGHMSCVVCSHALLQNDSVTHEIIRCRRICSMKGLTPTLSPTVFPHTPEREQIHYDPQHRLTLHSWGTYWFHFHQVLNRSFVPKVHYTAKPNTQWEFGQYKYFLNFADFLTTLSYFFSAFYLFFFLKTQQVSHS